MTGCGAGMSEQGIASFNLEEALDRHPCKHCGRHYNDHSNMSKAQMEDARKQGCIVGVCETRRRWTFDGEEGECREDEAYWCVIVILPDDPCDEEFMKEIST